MCLVDGNYENIFYFSLEFAHLVLVMSCARAFVRTNQFMFTKLCELDVLTSVIAHHFQNLCLSRWYSALFPSSCDVA